MHDAVTRVLLIEDNPGHAELIRLALAKASTPFELCHVDRLAAGLERLATAPFDVILTDLSLPDSTGNDGIRRLRQQVASMPIVVLTSLRSDATALESLDLGAQDYLVKDLMTADILERAIRYAIQRQKNAEMRCLLDQVQASRQLLARKNRRLARLYHLAQRFVDNVSHEFRTPLTVIMEYVSMLREGIAGDLVEPQQRMLDIVADRADDLNNMVDDMLDVSKLRAGILGLSRRSCSIADIIEHVRPNLEKKSTLKGVSLEIAVAPNLSRIYCDPEKIGRVLVNLAVNAIKFSGQPGRVQIRVGSAEAASQIVVSVTDNGPGIDPAGLSQLFQRFKQLGAQSRGSTKGFGLGLNIAKELVALNFGELSVESRLGVGSTFSFTVPWDDPLDVTQRYLAHFGNTARELTLLTAELPRTIDADLADDADSLLTFLLRRRDVLFRPQPHRWLFLLAASADAVETFVDRAREMWLDTNRNRPSGPLPEPKLTLLGTWPMRTATREILASIASQLPAHDLALAH